MESPLRRYRGLSPPSDRRVPVVGRCARRRLSRSLLVAAATQGLVVAVLVFHFPPRCALVRFIIDAILLVNCCSRFVILGSGVFGRAYWMESPDGAVWMLIGANVAVFMLWHVADPGFMRRHFMISLDNFRSGRLHTLLTSAFSHAESNHLFANMFGLYFFGNSIANVFGPAFLLKLYVGGALTGSVFFLLEKAFLAHQKQDYEGWDTSRVAGLGASAAVNATILLQIFLYPKGLVYLYFLIPVPAALMGAAIIGADLLRLKRHGDVSGSAHLGGALVAALVWARIRKGWI